VIALLVAVEVDEAVEVAVVAVDVVDAEVLHVEAEEE